MALADLAGGDVAQLQRASSQPETGWRGRFACADWHKDGRMVEIVSDHFGSIPLYWIRLEELTAVATDRKSTRLNSSH